MGLLNFGAGNFSDALAGLSQGLLAYGSGNPNGLLTVPGVIARNRQDRLQNTRQQQLLDMEQQKYQQTQSEFQRKLAEDQKMQAAWAGLTGTGATGPNNGRPGGMAPQQGGILSSLSPELQTYLKALPPEQGMQALGGLLTQKPDKPDLVQAYVNGHMEWVPKDQATGMQSAAPERPPQGPLTYRPILDANGVEVGQVDSLGHKDYYSRGVDFTTPDGTHVAFGGSGPAGGSQMNASESTNATRGSVLKLGLDAFRRINPDNIRPGRMAAVDAGKSLLPTAAGNLVQSKALNKDEQAYLAGQGAITEAVTATITGAAYAPEQLINYQNIFVPRPGEDPSVSAEKLQRTSILLNQLDAAAAGGRLEQLTPQQLREAVEKAASANIGTPGGASPSGPGEGSSVVQNGNRFKMINGVWVYQGPAQ